MEATGARWSSDFTNRSEVIKAPLQEAFLSKHSNFGGVGCVRTLELECSPDLLLHKCGGERLQLQQLLCGIQPVSPSPSPQAEEPPEPDHQTKEQPISFHVK